MKSNSRSQWMEAGSLQKRWLSEVEVIRVGPSPTWWTSLWDRVKTETQTPWCHGWGRDKRAVVSQGPHQRLRGNMVPQMPWFWTSSLQHCKRRNFWCFKPPVCGSLLQQYYQTHATTFHGAVTDLSGTWGTDHTVTWWTTLSLINEEIIVK